jgi:hypothetical protein
VQPSLGFDQLRLQPIGLAALAVLPQDRRQVADRGGGVAVGFAELALQLLDCRLKQSARTGEVALRGDGAGQIVERAQRVARMLAPYFGSERQDMLLQPARLGEIALGADRGRQLAERLQGVAMRLAVDATAHRDDMFLDRPHLGQPPARPQHLGEVEHPGERFGVFGAETPAQLVDALLLLGQGWLLAHRSARL